MMANPALPQSQLKITNQEMLVFTAKISLNTASSHPISVARARSGGPGRYSEMMVAKPLQMQESQVTPPIKGLATIISLYLPGPPLLADTVR